jgi:hypothetical protein
MKDEATYVCDSCGEEIVVPIDVSAGSSQEYVEDCPVCCRPNVIHIEVDEDGDVRVWRGEGVNHDDASLSRLTFHLPIRRRPDYFSVPSRRRRSRAAGVGL